MGAESEVVVVRLGHRRGRDDRMTTHVGLTARALGADRIVFPESAEQAERTVQDITDRFGGPFTAECLPSPSSLIDAWEGTIVHLTMYGEPVQTRIGAIRSDHESDPLLIVVGAEKVPYSVFETADWNIAVTNQPHSEVASLAVFLDRLLDGRQFDRTWENANQRVIPQREGKHVESIDTDERS